MRLLVCGGRSYADALTLFRALDEIHKSRPIALLINGGAKGADELARDWARSERIAIETWEAEWGKYNERAGPFRNACMLTFGRPDMVVAFHGGRGTADMIRRALAANIRVLNVGEKK